MARKGNVTRPSGDCAVVTMPVPPSVNQLYRNVPGRGRVKTRHYADWVAQALRQLRTQNWDYVPGRTVVCMKIPRPAGRKSGDLDNKCKAALDLLVKAGVMDDDKNVVGIAMCWAPAGDDIASVAVLKAADLDFCFRLNADGGSGAWFLIPPEETE